MPSSISLHLYFEFSGHTTATSCNLFVTITQWLVRPGNNDFAAQTREVWCDKDWELIGSKILTRERAALLRQGDDHKKCKQ